MQSRKLDGVERDRAIIRSTALRIVREIVEKPLFYGMKNRRELRSDALAPPSMDAFQHLEPLGFGLPMDDWWVFAPEDCQPDLVWPLNVGYVIDKAKTEDGEAMSAARYITVTPKQVRGVASRFSPFMVRTDMLQEYPGGVITAAAVYAWLGKTWVDSDNRFMWHGRNDNPLPDYVQGSMASTRPAFGTSLALKHRYEWAVSLGLENSPSIRFVTDPTGIKDVFRIRDLPPGKDRREALMNWVTDHWRQDRNDDDTEVYVRKHLRGSTSFSWRDMKCTLLPSQFDLSQRDKAAVEREAMRVVGTDHRKKGKRDAA